MGDYNPHTPRILGQEWVPIRNEIFQLSPAINSLEQGHNFNLAASRTVTQGRFYVASPPEGNVWGQMLTIAVYPQGKASQSGPVRSVIIPASAAIVSGFVTTNLSTVAEVLFNPSDGKTLTFTVQPATPTDSALIFFAVNTFAPLLNGKRILGVNVLYTANLVIDPGAEDPRPLYMRLLRPFSVSPLPFGPMVFQETNFSVSAQSPIERMRLGEMNHFWTPSSNPGGAPPVLAERMPFSYAGLQQFELGSSDPVGVFIECLPAFGYTLQIGYMALEVIYCEEQRIAIGGSWYLANLAAVDPTGILQPGANALTMRTNQGYALNPVLTTGNYDIVLSSPDPGDLWFGNTEATAYSAQNALRELYQIPSHPGVQVNIPFPPEDSIGSTFEVVDTHVLPQLSLHTSAGTMVEPHVYGRQAVAQVYGNVVAIQDIDNRLVTNGGLLLPGTAGNYASTPDNAALDIVGDIDLRGDVTMVDWTPAVNSAVVAKWVAAAQQSYILEIAATTGFIRLVWSTTGANTVTSSSTVAPTISNGQRLAIRATLAVASGTATFYTAPTIAGPWTQLGNTVVTGATSIFSSTSPVEVGTINTGTGDLFVGTIHAVEIRAGINSLVVADPFFTMQPPGTTSFTDGVGRVWTVNGTASIINSSAGFSTLYPWVRYYARRFGDTTVPLQLNTPDGLSLPGIPGNYASTPDNAALDIVGDIDLRIDLAMADWTPPEKGAYIAKWVNAGNQLSYLFEMSGSLVLFWTTSGAVGTLGSAVPTVPLVVSDGQRLAVRVTMDVDNGAAGRTITFYTAPTIAGPWTQLGAPVVQGTVTSIFSGTAPLEIGSNDVGVNDRLNGVVYAAEVRSGIDGTVVANPNFAAQAAGTTSFADSAGRTWTVNSTSTSSPTAQIVQGSVASITPSEFDALNEILDGWKEVNLEPFPVPDMNDVTSYPAWTWSANGENSGNRWEVLGAAAPALTGAPPIPLFQVPTAQRLGVATYGQSPGGDTINLAWVPGIAPLVSATTDDPMSDAVIIFGQDMPAVSGFTITTLTQAVSGIGQQCGIDPCCIPTDILYNRITWGLPANTGVAEDSFTRTVAAGGWGDADVGGTYTLTGTAADWSVNGTQGVLVNSTTSADRFAVLSAGINFDVTVDAAISTVPTTAGRAGAVGRYTDTANQYIGRYEVDSVGGVTLAILKRVANTQTSLMSTVSQVLIGGSGAFLTIRFMGQGTLLKLKVWRTGDPEPPTWDLETSDTSLTTGSLAGVYARDAGTVNTYLFDNLKIGPPAYWFGNYELQRMDTVETDWQTIMAATDPGTTVFNDYEARISITSSYRIRGVDVYDFPGPWSSTITSTIPTPGISGGCVSDGHILVFTSNERQDGSINLAYSSVWMDSQVEEDFTFPEAGFVQLQAMYNRDFVTAFRPLERGGEAFERTVLVQAAAIAPETLADFRSLRDMAWDTTPYICVRDEDGNRWLATVLVPSGMVLRDRRLYLAPVSIIEVTDTPSPVNP